MKEPKNIELKVEKYRIVLIEKRLIMPNKYTYITKPHLSNELEFDGELTRWNYKALLPEKIVEIIQQWKENN